MLLAADLRSRARRVAGHSALLAGTSALALLLTVPLANAHPVGLPATTSATTTASNAAVLAAQQAATMAQQSQQSLARAAQALAAMRAAQAAARAAATGNAGAMPSGLVTGGLVPDSGLAAPGVAKPVSSWVGANTPTQSVSNGQTIVNIDQTQSSAVLNWQSFNVSASTTVNFNQQGHADWSALNRIAAGASPSQILGRINADGEVYLINQNGIIFGGTSQVNVHTLIASTLDVSPTLSASNYQLYLQNGLFSTLIGAGAAQQREAVFNSGGGKGTVVVQPGAVIDTSAKLTSTGDGGYVALLGAGGVSNAGQIVTQNGQLILAADNFQISLNMPAVNTVGTQTAMTAAASGGPVSNTGLLLTNDGAVTLAGSAISQVGLLLATTSTTRTASISLNANNGNGAGTGNVVLGPDSLTAILPDETSNTLPTATVNSTTNANGANNAPYFKTVLQPQITISASGSVDIQGHGAGQGGAWIKAPSAALSISAGSGNGSGTILLEPGSSIDLSGIAGVTLPMSINQVSILVTQAEVADDPLAKALIGHTVIVDARLSGTRSDGLQWVGSPVVSAAGFVGLIPMSIDQILTAGGSFTSSAKNFIQQPGAAINVSAGYVQYLGGLVSNTLLVGADGHIYTTGNAPANIPVELLTGFTINHSHWSTKQADVTEIFAVPFGAGHFEPGYVSGANGGSISVTAAVPVLAGDIVADVVAGDRQRALAGSSNLALSDQMPTGASLSIAFPSNTLANTKTAILEPVAAAGPDPFGLIAGGFSFATESTWAPKSTDAIPFFSDRLSDMGFGSISITGASQLSMPAGASLTVLPGGKITLDGVTTIDGTLNAPAGSINLTGFTYGTKQTMMSPPTAAVVIGPDAVLNVRGLWVNDTGLQADEMQGRAFVNGGSVSITTIEASAKPPSATTGFADVTQSIVLAPGSIIDVSSGGYVGFNGKLKTGSDGLPVGKGGSVSLTTALVVAPTQTGGETQLPYNQYPTIGSRNQANVVLGGMIFAWGYDGGGTFSLQAPTISIDGGVLQPTIPATGELVLPPSFFTAGFSQYALTSTYGSDTVTAGTEVVLRQTSFLAGAPTAPTGAAVRDFAAIGVLPVGVRKPVGLALNQTGAYAMAPITDRVAGTAGVLIDRGAVILADPQAAITVSSAGEVTVLGSIIAPGGSISISNVGFGGSSKSVVFPVQEVLIGSEAVLDVSGTFVPSPTLAGRSLGTVLDAGSISLLSISAGTVVVQPGAELDLQGAAVSAASNLIQQPVASEGVGARLVGQAAWSNGGNLLLGATNVYFAGSVNARGGAPLAAGGSLTIGNSDGSGVLPNDPPSPDVIVIEPADRIAASLATGKALPSGAFIGVDTLNDSGFDSVTLNANQTIAFNGSVSVSIPGALTMRADRGNIVLLPASVNGALLAAGVTDPATFVPTAASIQGATVNLDAGYVRISGENGLSNFAGPRLADGTLNITAQWIDLERTIALDNVGTAKLTSAGAIRLLPQTYGFGVGSPSATSAFGGALFAPGNLTLQAAEIYPVSNTAFLLASTSPSGKLTILQNGTAVAPLSAGGSILLSAKSIVQDGSLWAPLGSIVIGTTSQIPSMIATVVNGQTTYGGPALAATDSVVLGSHSLTSVSAAGLDIPDGFAVDDATWYIGTPGDQNTKVLTAPPPKAISLLGANVTTSQGAVLDLSGGGDIYATEFVAGSGGTRNVLTTYQQNLANANSFSPTFADGRQVYALVPSSEAKVAAYDPSFAVNPTFAGATLAKDRNGNPIPLNAIAPGQSVTIGPGSGVPAGSYVLLPGMYATLPGAYRVVQVASNVNPTTRSATGADGSQYVVGKLGNALTGAQSSQSAIFQLQSQAVWSQYSRIDITSGTSFFRNLALAAGVAPPPLPIDGGVLTLGATNNLTLLGGNRFAPGISGLAPGLTGAGGQVQISGENILILASDQTVPSADCTGAPGCTGSKSFLVLDADQLSALGASTMLIGGTATVGTDGTELITATALNLEVRTDDAHKLTGPEIVLVSLAPTSPDASKRGLVVDDGSVITAVGAVPAGTDRDIVIGVDPVGTVDVNGKLTYSAGVSGDGALLRVSNGKIVNVTRHFVPGLYVPPATNPAPTPPVSKTPLGQLTIGNATIEGGNALTLDTSGKGTLASGAVLHAANYDLAGSVINIGGGSSGFVLNAATLQNLAGATSVRLRSATVINLFDASGLEIGDPSNPIGTLTFDSDGLYSQSGGSTTVSATNIDLANSFGATGSGTDPVGGGTLTLNATGTLTEDVGGKSLLGFSTVNLNAAQAIAFSGSGSLDTGSAPSASLILDVGGVAIQHGGTGYTSVPTVTIAGTGGSGATAIAVLGVTQIAVSAGGTGYVNGDVVTVTGPNGTGFTGTAIVTNGAITGVNITHGGSGFTGAIAAVTVTSAKGSGATLAASLGVVAVNVTHAGAGFTAIPTLSFSGGGGTGAAAQVLAAVTGITLTSPGANYGQAPSVTIVGGGGTGGKATASIAGGSVSGLQLVQGGSGYASLPIVVFSGATDMTLSAPVIVANAGASQSLSTTGLLTLRPNGGTAPAFAATNTGGAVAMAASAIEDSAVIRALSGKVSLVATTGDLELSGNALIDAAGSRFSILDVTEDAPGGNVLLASNLGNVKVDPNAKVSVAGAGIGLAGSLSIIAAGAATLDGALDGSAAFKDTGGNFSLIAGSLPSSALLAINGLTSFSGSVAVQVLSGNLTMDAGQTLSSGKVTLVANAGSVAVNGTIDASGPSGGAIALYGATGVNVGGTARLLARYAIDDPADPAYAGGASTLVQTGGTITLGTIGTPDGTLNASYGYENVTNSGRIQVDAGAIFDVSGGPGGANINNAGGTVYVHAPILTTNNINVGFAGTLVTNAVNGKASGGGIVANAYAVWSTADKQADLTKYFDGIIDPAGWFDALGNALPGTDQAGHAMSAPTPQSPAPAGTLFTATTPNQSHIAFYQSTLSAFVENPFGDAAKSTANTDAVAADFSGARLRLSGASTDAQLPLAQLHLRPEIDLVNPGTAVNNGNITVASNWNLGAGSDTVDAKGNFNVTLTYRTNDGKEPGVLTLLAANNVNINATVTDGFFTTYTPSGDAVPDALSQYIDEFGSQNYTLYKTNFLTPHGNATDPNTTFTFNVYGTQSGATLTEGNTPGAAFFGLGTVASPNTAAYDALKLQFVLYEPTVFSGSADVKDQYNQYYKQYVTMFDAYAQEMNLIQGHILGYQDFVNFKSPIRNALSPLSNNAGTTGGHIGIPAPPTLSSAYLNLITGLSPLSLNGSQGYVITAGTTYADLWTAYFLNIIQIDLINNGKNSLNLPGAGTAIPSFSNMLGLQANATITAAIAPTPPAPPPQYTTTQPGFQSSVPSPHPADLIANNPAGFQGGSVVNTTAAAALMSVPAAVSAGSFSYDIVAGTAFTASGGLPVDPASVIPTSSLSSALTGNVTINGHTSYTELPAQSNLNRQLTINIPTLVRTGTGSITIASAGDVQFLDQTAPGAVYTAGTPVAALPPDFIAPTRTASYESSPNGLFSVPTWTSGGGAITVTAGGSIIGVEMPIDATGNQTATIGQPIGQLWSDWYAHYGSSNGTVTPFAKCSVATCQTASWINFATFFQGFGALGGGNITLAAGANIRDVGASLPETVVVGGGLTTADPPHATYYGGGNLSVTAGGDILSSDFLVGRGTGLVQAGGAVQAGTSASLPAAFSPTGALLPLPLLLAVQDGFISVIAKGSVTVGNIYDPASLPLNNAVQTLLGNLPGGTSASVNGVWNDPFTSFGPNSGVALTSAGGDVAMLAMSSGTTNSIFVHTNLFGNITVNLGGLGTTIGRMLPATLELTSLSGNVSVNSGPTSAGNANLVPYPTQAGDDTGTITLVAAGSINLGRGLSMPDLVTSTTQFFGDGVADISNYISPLGLPLANLTQALHADDPNPVVIAAGKNIIASGATMTLIKPAVIEAGNNIVGANAPGNLPATQNSGPQISPFGFTGQNNDPGDITSISAGNDFVGGSYTLYGPGIFLVQAGRNLGPFQPSNTTPSGIMTIGNGSALGSQFATTVRPYLPPQGAELDVLFGVGPGIDYASFINTYINPANIGANGFIEQFVVTTGGQTVDLSSAAGWALFQQLPSVRQHLLADRVFLNLLTVIGKDAKDPTSPFAGQYGRAYQMISTLFPASLGYTDNGTGTGNGAATTVKTGNFNIAASVLETQMGGDINIMGPGGGITVGHSSLDILKPNLEGILTLEGGTIRAFTDGSILLNQSRVMTQQGGDVDMFVANGDINAGSGPKSYVSSPSVSDVCTVNGFCYTNPQGQVTGAGIAALVTLAGQDPTKSNANLFAPHGTIDAGSAGIRVAGNAVLGALQILNAYNIQVQGAVTGLPTTMGPPVVALTTANTTTAAAVKTETPQQSSSDRPSVIIVEFLGFGGGDEEPVPDRDKRERRGEIERQTQDLGSRFQVIGAGNLTDEQTEQLTAENRRLTGR